MIGTNSGIELTDKDLHCIARRLQFEFFPEEDETAGKECSYCKYALECKEDIRKTGKPHWLKGLPEKLEKMTGVKVHFFERDRANEHLLHGSWAEGYPDLLEKLKGMTLSEQGELLSGEKSFGRMQGS